MIGMPGATLPQALDEARRVGLEPDVEDDQVDARGGRFDDAEQLPGAARADDAMTRAAERRGEAVHDVRRVDRNHHGLRRQGKPII